jgi:hypothetical protein
VCLQQKAGYERCPSEYGTETGITGSSESDEPGRATPAWWPQNATRALPDEGVRGAQSGGAGQGELLKLEIKTFSHAAEQFVEWAKGEHRERPNTWKRLRGSMTSLKVFFGHQPLPFDNRRSDS